MKENMSDLTPSQFEDIVSYLKSAGTYDAIRIFPVWYMLDGLQAVSVPNNNKKIVIFQNGLPVAVYILNDDGCTEGVYYL
ncbi:hypothetical protein [Xenorhabdus sp. SGI246]|uniref:hypothetical protein n=1 Tax=Xenorhabdus sp. SGI246 TaxID=3158263 RepID=UPI00349F61AF